MGHLDLEVTGGTIAWGGAFWHRHWHCPSARRLGHGKAMAESQLIANHAIMLMFIPFIPSSNLRDEYSRATGK
jgi:hypothetical protein